MAAGYWNSNYWHTNYWNANYWTPGGSITGDYWNDNFWNVNYWNINYWLEVSDGDVNQRNAAQLSLTVQVPTVNVGLNVEPDTEVLPLVTFQADANYDISLTPATEVLPLTPYNASLGFEGYQLGDIDLRWVPDSGIVVTYGVVTDLEALPLTGQLPSVDVGDLTVAASFAALNLQTLVTNASNNIVVQPLPEALSLTGFNVTAGIGTQVPTTIEALSFGLATHTIEGTEGLADAFPLPVFLDLPAYNAIVIASDRTGKPASTFGDYGALILNDNAAALDINNYEICDRSGFRVIPGTLVKDGYGWMVRPESREGKHPQDFVKSRPDKQEGSKRPEQRDQFIGVDTPAVSASDL